MASHTTFLTVISCLELLILAYIFTKAIRILQFYALYSSELSRYKPRPAPAPLLANHGPCGASDGIGNAFAQDPCRRGFNVIIHGRDEQKLHRVAGELEKAYPDRKIRLLVIDAIKASWTDEETDKKVLNAVTGVQLTMLINNVRGAGAARGAWAPIMQRSAGELDALINLNAAFMTQMTRVLIPVLAQRQRAAIVNISSAAELVPAPYLVAYSAAKAYVSRCSVSLDAELRVESQGHIDVHSLIVGAVATPNASHD